MDNSPRENGRSNIFKASSNSHKLLDSYGFTDQGREWAAELNERIIGADNTMNRLLGKTPIVKIDTDPTKDVSDAEIVDDKKEPKREGGGGAVPPLRKRRRR